VDNNPIGDCEDSLEARLQEALAKCEHLRSDNKRLKKLLKSFSLKPAAAIRLGKPKSRSGSEHLSTLVAPESTKISDQVAERRIELFRSLFRGREDVYAVRWRSKKGKTGYSPACANEWDPLLCRKPCAKCQNARYIPLTDNVVRDHLLGKITIGVYPLCQDETCYFLATDFDKAGWEQDAQAFLQTSRDLGVPAAFERSRSGKGGHVWIFFSGSVPAAMARKLGSAILTRTMGQRHKIGLESYDRLFPNQDTIPKGGFGNLIALPLQREPRKKGNSVFLDDNLTPYANQWQFLESAGRMPEERVRSIVQKAARHGRIIGVRLSLTGDTADEDPWTLPPSKKRPGKPIIDPLPSKVSVIRSNLLYIEKQALPSQAIDRLIRIAAFQNPEFYRAQAMRLSTFGKPRIIACAEEFPHHVALPRGCLDEVRTFFKAHAVTLDIRDKRVAGSALDVSFRGELRPEQQKVTERLRAHENGVLVAPSGFGKTVLASWLIAQRKVNTVVLVHRTSLLEQWREQIALFLGLDIREIGVIGAGRRKPSGGLDVAMIQSLQKKGEVIDLVADYGQVIVDECHHISAFTFERIMREVKAKYILGLTTTPIRKDGHHPIIFMQCGPVRVRIHAKKTAAQRPFEHVVLFRRTEFTMPFERSEPSIQEIYRAIAMDTQRNTQIIDDVSRCVAAGRSPLVLTERIEHLVSLAERLEDVISNVFILRGNMGRRQRKAVADRLSSIRDKDPYVIVATGRYAGEGFDESRLDTLFLTMPISWRGTLKQYVGRLHRAHAGKHEARVYDYVDHNVPMLVRMFAKRLRGYRALGYTTDGQMNLPEDFE